jgi:hypothetical protein
MTPVFDRITGWFRHGDRSAVETTVHPDDQLPVRYRPHLVAELLVDGSTARGLMRALLDACRSHDEELQIARLRNFADCFQRTTLLKQVQFYAYLHWALGRDATTMLHFRTVQADVQRHALGIQSLLAEYLGAPWLRAQRRRFVQDMAHMATALAHLLRLEESTLFPLYLPYGQYRYLGDTPPG